MPGSVTSSGATSDAGRIGATRRPGSVTVPSGATSSTFRNSVGGFNPKDDTLIRTRGAPTTSVSCSSGALVYCAYVPGASNSGTSWLTALISLTDVGAPSGGVTNWALP